MKPTILSLLLLLGGCTTNMYDNLIIENIIESNSNDRHYTYKVSSFTQGRPDYLIYHTNHRYQIGDTLK